MADSAKRAAPSGWRGAVAIDIQRTAEQLFRGRCQPHPAEARLFSGKPLPAKAQELCRGVQGKAHSRRRAGLKRSAHHRRGHQGHRRSPSPLLGNHPARDNTHPPLRCRTSRRHFYRNQQLLGRALPRRPARPQVRGRPIRVVPHPEGARPVWFPLMGPGHRRAEFSGKDLGLVLRRLYDQAHTRRHGIRAERCRPSAFLQDLQACG